MNSYPLGTRPLWSVDPNPPRIKMIDAPQIIQNTNGIWMLEGEQLWDSDILPICLEHIKEGDTVIDAGAWIGGHTLEYARKVGVKGHVISFEPNPAAFVCLKRNTDFHNTEYQNIDRFQIALGDQTSLVSLSVKKGWMDSSYVTEDQKVNQVLMQPLDSVLRDSDFHGSVNFIKIDVEGCELKVLKGAVKTIEKYRPTMVIEINKPALERQGNTRAQVFDWLSEHGYDYSMIENAAGEDIYNILCIPR